MSFGYCFSDGEVIRAMPRLSSLLSDDVIHQLEGELSAISIALHEVSLSQQRRVSRIPLKPPPISSVEAKYMAQS